MRISGCVAVVFGASREVGIGFAYVEALLERDAKVVFCDILTEIGKQTEKKLQNRFAGERACFVHCDVTQTESVTGGLD